MIWLGQPAQEPSWDHNGNWCWQKIRLNIFSNHWVYFSHILLYYAICMICQPVFIGSFCTGASLTIAMANLLEINIKIRGRNTNVNMINIVRGTRWCHLHSHIFQLPIVLASSVSVELVSSPARAPSVKVLEWHISA